MTSFTLRGALGAAACLLASSAALAHAVLERREAEPNTAYRATVQIMHGCDGSPTTSVKVSLPEGAVAARPLPKAGWTVTTSRGPFIRSYEAGHGTVSEGVKEVTWSGGRLADDHFDEFVVSLRLTDAFRPGDTVHFPVEQVCENGRRHWTQMPGGTPVADGGPAPGLRIVQAAGAAAAPAGAAAPTSGTFKAGAIAVEQPWLRATPGGAKVAGGYLRVTNSGREADRLVGAAIPVAGRGEVHETVSEGGVAKMRPLERGLEIAPGASLELKPGGLHLMFLDLKAPVKEGAPVRGTLTFEKAGTVEVLFGVAPAGAPGPASGGGHAHH
jgi:copper(I)-binding protein/uncharacterized protein YcnI